MALIRRSGARFSANIWPGFVDAMTAILLVLMFVLSIFMIVQSILRDTITGQNSELAFLNTELVQIRNDLGLERSKLARLDARYEEKLKALSLTEEKFNGQKLENEKLDLQLRQKALNLETLKSNFVGLTSKLQIMKDQLFNKTTAISLLQKKQEKLQNKAILTDTAAKERIALLSALRAKFEVSNKRTQTFQTQVAGLILRNTKLNQNLDQSKTQVAEIRSENELVKLALSSAREENDKNAQEARLAAARADALEALASDLRTDQKALNNLTANLVKKLGEKEVTISENTKALNIKSKKIEQVETNIILEKAAVENLKEKLSSESEELGLLTLTLEAERKKALRTLELLASARAVREALKEKNKELIFSTDASDQALELKKSAVKEARAQLIEEKDLT